MAHLQAYNEQMGGFDLTLSLRYQNNLMAEIKC